MEKIKKTTNKRTGLVMEGGAMRGMFTCGVIDVFMENGIEFDGAIGVSAGAVFGCNYKSHQIGRGIRYNKKYCKDERMGSMKSFLKTGDIYDVEFAYHELPYVLDPFDTETFQANPMDFWIVATNVETGKAEYHLCTDGGEEDLEWFRASASIPILSRVVEIGDLKLVDGGTADSVPIRFMMDQGYKKIVTILTQPEGFVKKKSKVIPIARIMLRKYPKVIRLLENRHKRYNKLYAFIDKCNEKGKTLVIRPSEPLGVGSMENDPEQLERVYQIGRKVATERLEDVKNYLNS